ncbi:MAG TPA: Hsp20 family protein [Clostridiales bacterium]|nr:MAG: 18 kDa heat shock protein [Firmicutes bacterium ADurb.Bin262]HOU10043.1 Hsp20 family protein [Clostridiales bacterium]HQH62570.1 Hsp20 family protein [Clostridiales bacterium]HQK72355.1 Hsp20 family protein [Clostridiales bacterium]
MSGLVPFNRKRSELANVGFGDFYNMLDDFFADGWPLRRSLGSDTFKLDVKEDEKAYTVTADLPGVKKEELNLSMEEGRLQISVNREEKTEEENKNYVHRERVCCSMQRNIYLADADEGAVKAKLEDGVLTITVPKKEKKDTSIAINIE